MDAEAKKRIAVLEEKMQQSLADLEKLTEELKRKNEGNLVQLKRRIKKSADVAFSILDPESNTG